MDFPDKFNMASYFLDDRLREGKGEKVAVRSKRRSMTYLDVVRISLPPLASTRSWIPAMGGRSWAKPRSAVF